MVDMIALFSHYTVVYGNIGRSLLSSAGVIVLNGASVCKYSGELAHRFWFCYISICVDCGIGWWTIYVGGWCMASTCSCLAGVLGFSLVYA